MLAETISIPNLKSPDGHGININNPPLLFPILRSYSCLSIISLMGLSCSAFKPYIQFLGEATGNSSSGNSGQTPRRRQLACGQTPRRRQTHLVADQERER
ncbi:MAG: hypothetical protein WBA93_30850 [Microcoleaceae cyanobacterium]